jgi:hypothetical protein
MKGKFMLFGATIQRQAIDRSDPEIENIVGENLNLSVLGHS